MKVYTLVLTRVYVYTRTSVHVFTFLHFVETKKCEDLGEISVRNGGNLGTLYSIWMFCRDMLTLSYPAASQKHCREDR
jgi:hypothetical protein